jgi:branched-chain amino acid transport system substrate-binding protein
MKRKVAVVLLSAAVLGCSSLAQQTCSCGANPPGRPTQRAAHPYAGAPDDLRPFSKFTKPYYEHYTDLVEYNGAARDIADPDVSALTEIRIGFIAPLSNHPDEAFGRKMLNGAQMALDEANARGGYCGKPFKLMLHNDSATWGASSNEVVKMVYDEKVWAMFGSISADTTHIALRVALKAEVPLINSASTDPTIPETIIPWYFTDIQDDRVQGYTLARRIYTELGLKRIALLRVNDRYGRFGVLKFKDASRRLGHPVVIEQKFLPGSTDFRHQLRVIADSRVDGIVLWTNEAPAAIILKQMRELGLKQPVFGSHRMMGATFVKEAGSAAEGVEAVVPYDPSRREVRWLDFNERYAAKYQQNPDHFSALAYDAMQVLLDGICRAGLNRGRIRDALTGVAKYSGVTGEMIFDPNCKNVSPMYLATVRNGQITYRVQTIAMPSEEHAGTPYARVGEDGVSYTGPRLPDTQGDARVAVFGPNADEVVRSLGDVIHSLKQKGQTLSLVAVPSDVSWGKASTMLVDAMYKQHVLGIVALDRNASHLAEQLAVKLFVPVIGIADDRSLTSTNIAWIYRMPEGTAPERAVNAFAEAIKSAGTNRAKVRDVLADSEVAGMRFSTTGEPKQVEARK